jgi:uncharacterized small protein (DUF1192 family)
LNARSIWDPYKLQDRENILQGAVKRRKPEQKQVVFENTHEPIIDPETWERVQELREQRKRPNRYDEMGLFPGLLFWADCGSVLYQRRYQTDKCKQDCCVRGSCKKQNAANRNGAGAAEKRMADLSNIFKRLYEDDISGKVSYERYMELSADYEAGQKEFKGRVATLQAEIDRVRTSTSTNVNVNQSLMFIHQSTRSPFWQYLCPVITCLLAERIL